MNIMKSRAPNLLRLSFLGLLLVCCHQAAPQEVAIWNNASDGFRSQALIRTGQPAASPSFIGPYDAQHELAQEMSRRVGSNIDALMGQLGTRIVLVSVDRKIVYENYAMRWMRKTTPLGYSMSKSLTAVAVGHALCADSRLSLQAKLEQHIPRLNGTSWGAATIEDLLLMKSGSTRQEPARAGWQSEDVAAFHRRVYLGTHTSDVVEAMLAHDLKTFSPGEVYQYSNYDTLALGLYVEAVTGKKFYDYFFQVVWPSIGAAESGAWLVNELDQSFSAFGFSASPEDWLRIGHYVLERMNNPDCLGQFLRRAIQPREQTHIPSRCYGYQIWNWCSRDVFFFFGYGGQYLIMYPARRWVAYAHQTSHMNDARLIQALRGVMNLPRD